MAVEVIKQAKNGNLQASIADKSLCEMYSVLTKTYKITSEQAGQLFDYYLFSVDFEIISSSPETPFVISKLLKKTEVKGRYIFDIWLIALMLENNIETIYTKNIKDFIDFSEIKVVDPLLS